MKRAVKSSSYATNAIRSRINNMLVDGTTLADFEVLIGRPPVIYQYGVWPPKVADSGLE